MSCERAAEVHAYLDGELDAVAAVAIERHMASCADCAALREEILAIRQAMRSASLYHHASGELRARVARALDRRTLAETTKALARRRPFWTGVLGGSAITAMAAAVLFAFMEPSMPNLIASEVVAAHMRSLMGNRLIDIASSDRHTVKPWFDGHVAVSPPVGDYARQGFTLIGGRVDFVDDESVPVVVYRHGKHVVDVFVWKDDGNAKTGLKTRRGYHLLAWKGGDLFYCAVSDIAPQDLTALEGLIRKTAQT